MGQQLYALLKVGWARIPRSVRETLRPNDAYEPFLVRNVSLPGVLVWTGIDAHALAAEEEERALVAGQLASLLPPSLLSAQIEPRGILLFPDGGEPHRSWRKRTSYDELEHAFTALAARGCTWMKIEATPAQASDPVGDLLTMLPDAVIVQALVAREKGDADGVRRILLEHLGERNRAAIDAAVRTWTGRGHA